MGHLELEGDFLVFLGVLFSYFGHECEYIDDDSESLVYGFV